MNAAFASGMVHAFLILILLVLLTGCVTACPPDRCIGPYDLTLSSHREGLGLD